MKKRYYCVYTIYKNTEGTYNAMEILKGAVYVKKYTASNEGCFFFS